MSQCVAPQEVQDGDLLAYIEGEASLAVRAHLVRCLFCTQEIAALQQVNALFTAAFHRGECPESELMLRYQAELVSTTEKRRVERHVKVCQDCQAELTELTGSLAPSMLNRLATAVSQSLKEAGKQVIEAVLLPAQPSPALALRGAQQQQAIYQAGPYQLILAKVPPIVGEPTSPNWQIEGQLTAGSRAEVNGRVSLQRSEEPVASDNLDEFGYFALEQLSPGSYTLQIELSSSLVSLADFTIP
jgi:hypothetical protein